MDKFNVIRPTDNLDELNKDMMDWYYLPLSMRYCSDDDCKRLYGCTNIELYNKIKMAILNQKDRDNIEKDNIMKAVDEATSEFELMNQEMLLNMSKKLQQSPNIVIIDPDIDNIEDLNTRYNKYTLLLDKYKRFSDNYSLQLWGYNVITMYHMMRGKLSLNPDDIDNNNIMVDNVSESIEEYANSLVVDDIFNKYIVEDNQLGLCKLKLDYLEANIPTAIKERYKECFDNMNIDFCDELALPRITPWFTPNEIKFTSFENSILDPNLANMNMNDYAKAVSEAMSNYNESKSEEDKNKLLSLGWNPEVSITEETVKYAKERQKKFCMRFPLICNLEVVDLSVVESNTELSYNNNYPLFIIVETKDDNGIEKVSKVGVTFMDTSKTIYTFYRNEDGILTFIRDSIDNFDKVIVFATFVDTNSYKLISNTCEKLISNNNSMYRISSSIYDILGNPITMVSDSYRVLVANVIYKLVQFASYTADEELKFYPNRFAISNVNYIYKVYSGYTKDLTDDECKKIVSILLDNNSRGEFAYIFANIESYNIDDSSSDKIRDIYKEILSILTPSNSIIYRGE